MMGDTTSARTLDQPDLGYAFGHAAPDEIGLAPEAFVIAHRAAIGFGNGNFPEINADFTATANTNQTATADPAILASSEALEQSLSGMNLG